MKCNQYHKFFETIANKSRWRILEALAIKPLTVTEMCNKLKEEQSKVRLFARIHAILWTIIIGASIYFQTWFPILYLLLPFVYGTTMIHIIQFIQHAGLTNDVQDHRLTTRSVKLNPFFNFLCWNMEYHLEHHMYPMIPSYNLIKLHELIKDQLPSAKKNLWEAYKEIIPAIVKQAKNPNYKIDVQLPNTELT